MASFRSIISALALSLHLSPATPPPVDRSNYVGLLEFTKVSIDSITGTIIIINPMGKRIDLVSGMTAFPEVEPGSAIKVITGSLKLNTGMGNIEATAGANFRLDISKEKKWMISFRKTSKDGRLNIIHPDGQIDSLAQNAPRHGEQVAAAATVFSETPSYIPSSLPTPSPTQEQQVVSPSAP